MMVEMGATDLSVAINAALCCVIGYNCPFVCHQE